MRANRDHIHAHLGTRENLLADARFIGIIESVEAFNQGSPFTLVRCPALGKGDINLTESVRQTLAHEHWVPESGESEIIALAPANARGLVVELSLPIDPGHLSEVHLRFEPAFFGSAERDKSLALIRSLGESIDLVFGYIHHALDEALQDATDPKQYRALTGNPPPREPIDVKRNPGRSLRAGQVLLTVRWVSLLGSELVERVGRDRVAAAPCAVELSDTGMAMLRLYDDPMTFDRPEHREVQTEVRHHLGIDELADMARWEALERRPTTDPEIEAPPPLDRADEPLAADLPDEGPRDAGQSATLHLFELEEAAPDELIAFYAAQARRAAGRVLEIGCGIGQVTIQVARTGVPVVAVDDRPDPIEHLRRGLTEQSAGLQGRTTLLLGDPLTVDVAAHGPYAAIFLPAQAINRFVHRQKLREVLETLRQSLQPGGLIALDTFFPRPERWSDAGHATVHLRRFGPTRDGGSPMAVHEVIEADVVAQRLLVTRRLDELDAHQAVTAQRYLRLELGYYYPDELRDLLELAGFQSRVTGGWGGLPLTSPDQPVVIVGQRV